MIELRESNASTLTVSEFMDTLMHSFHEYFPESYFECFIRNELEDSESWIVVGLHLIDEEHCSWGVEDPFRNLRFAVFLTQADDYVLGDVFEDSVMSPEVWVGMDNDGYYFGLVSSYLHGKVYTEEVPANLSIGKSEYHTTKEILEWFDDYCGRLYKTTCKMFRKGHLDEEVWEKYL